MVIFLQDLPIHTWFTSETFKGLIVDQTRPCVYFYLFDNEARGVFVDKSQHNTFQDIIIVDKSPAQAYDTVRGALLNAHWSYVIDDLITKTGLITVIHAPGAQDVGNLIKLTGPEYEHGSEVSIYVAHKR